MLHSSTVITCLMSDKKHGFFSIKVCADLFLLRFLHLMPIYQLQIQKTCVLVDYMEIFVKNTDKDSTIEFPHHLLLEMNG